MVVAGVVVGVVLGGVVVVVVVVVGVVVAVLVVVFGTLVVGVVCTSGSTQSASARTRRFWMPWRSVWRSPVSSVAGSASKSCSVFRIALSVVAQLPLPASASCATVSKSLCSGPEDATGISLSLELPQETSSAAARPSRANRPYESQLGTCRACNVSVTKGRFELPSPKGTTF